LRWFSNSDRFWWPKKLQWKTLFWKCELEMTYLQDKQPNTFKGTKWISDFNKLYSKYLGLSIVFTGSWCKMFFFIIALSLLFRIRILLVYFKFRVNLLVLIFWWRLRPQNILIAPQKCWLFLNFSVTLTGLTLFLVNHPSENCQWISKIPEKI